MFATRMLTLDLFARANLIVDIRYIFGTGNDLPTAARFFSSGFVADKDSAANSAIGADLGV